MNKLYKFLLAFLSCEIGFMIGTLFDYITTLLIIFIIIMILITIQSLIIREEIKMMKTKYILLIKQFIEKYNKDHVATKIRMYEDPQGFVYIVNQDDEIMAKAPNKQDMAIMLCMCDDTRTNKDEDYWLNSTNKWKYSPLFLHEIMTRYRRNK